MRLATALLVLWFLCASALSIAGWLAYFSAGELFGAGAFAATAGFAVLHSQSEKFRRFLRARNLKIITLGQVLRYYGLLAFAKSEQHILPSLFAIPTGIIDVVFATTSIFVATRLISPQGKPKNGFIVWHVLGLLGLGTSVVLAILTSSNRFGLVDQGITSQAMTQFPMSIVPTFIGPLMVVLHLQAITVAWTAKPSTSRATSNSTISI
jgi:hypothetical protein